MTPFHSLSDLIFGISGHRNLIVENSAVDGTSHGFAGAVSQMAASLEGASIQRGLLTATDTGTFLVGLLGMMRAGVEVVLPPNTRPGTLAEMSGTFDRIISDQPIDGVEIIPIAKKGESKTTASRDLQYLPVTFYTSGTQGSPKKVSKTAYALEQEARSINAAWAESGPADVVFGMVPHHHMYGMTFKVMWPALTGQTISAPHYEYWEDLLKVLTPKAFIVTSPSQLERAEGLGAVSPWMRPNRILSAGGVLSQKAADTAKAVFHIYPIEVFGSTEAGAIAWRNREKDLEPWRTFPMVSVTSTEGKMLVNSPYGSVQGATEDRISILSDGRFEFNGRADRTAKIEGKRVNLNSLERRILSHPWVADAALVVLTEGRERLGAIIKLSDIGVKAFQLNGAPHVRRDIRKSLRYYEDSAALPRSWRFVDDIPTNDLGKRTVQALLRSFESRPDDERPDPPATLPTVLEEHVGSESIEVGLYIPRALTAFNGHFPGFPVLPGVVQLSWAISFASKYFPIGEPPVNLRVKFQKIIVPDSRVKLVLSLDDSRGRISFKYISEQGTHSSGSWMIA